MKHHLLKQLTVLSFSAVLLVACGAQEEADTPVETEMPEEVEAPEDTENGEGEENPEESQVSQNVLDWLPPLENVHYVYEGQGSEYASFEFTSQYAQADAWQILQETSGTSLVIVYEYTETEIRQVHTREEVYYRENYIEPWNIDYRDEQEDVLLQAPIEEGHTWESPTGAEYEITGVNVEVDTPSGSYEAIEVTRVSGESETIRYYAEGVGLVQELSLVENESENITSSLAEIHENVSETISMNFYTLDSEAMGIDQIEGELKLQTNDAPRIAIANALSGGIPEMEDSPLLPESVEINHLFLDGNIAHIDFSEELVTDVQAGSGIESLILQSIINTIGDYYNAEEVLLTVESEPYSSGHVALEEGETFPVDYTNVNQAH